MRIIRFIDVQGNEQLGHAFQESESISSPQALIGVATLLSGELFGTLRDTREKAAVQKLLSPLLPSNIFAIGLNYREHTQESGFEQPEHPVVFMKSSASIVGHNDNIQIPIDCIEPPQVDYEGELAVVIGKPAKNVAVERALEYVLGYTVGNDVSARRWQKHAGARQWVKGKSFDTFCPLGPHLVTADEISNPQSLMLSTELNGNLMQQASTEEMIFTVAELIAYLSHSATLLPGTVILTGTPSGVGFSRQPPVYLMPGDQVSVKVNGVGVLSNSVVAELG